MTSYASLAELKAVIDAQVLIQLTDSDGAFDAVDDVKVQAALDDATSVINGYIAKRVTLPLVDVPRMLNVVCRDLAKHRLYANKGAVTDDVQKLHDAQIYYLKRVSKGELSIGDETGGDDEQTSPGVVMDEGPDRVMTRDNLRGF